MVIQPALAPEFLEPVLEPEVLESILHPPSECVRARQTMQLTQLQDQLTSGIATQEAPPAVQPESCLNPVQPEPVQSPVKLRWLNEHTVSSHLLERMIDRAHDTMPTVQIPDIAQGENIVSDFIVQALQTVAETCDHAPAPVFTDTPTEPLPRTRYRRNPAPVLPLEDLALQQQILDCIRADNAPDAIANRNAARLIGRPSTRQQTGRSRSLNVRTPANVPLTVNQFAANVKFSAMSNRLRNVVRATQKSHTNQFPPMLPPLPPVQTFSPFRFVLHPGNSCSTIHHLKH